MRLQAPLFFLVALSVASPGLRADDDKHKDKSKIKKQHKHEQRVGGDRDRDRDRDRDDDRDGKMTICHVPPGNPSARHTITIGEAAWSAHRNHGDERGPCRNRDRDRDDAFDRLDTNDDGVLTLDEWPRDRTSFDRYDRDDNGRVTLREWLNPPR